MRSQAEDTLHHCIWVCKHPHVVAARARFASSELRREAMTHGTNELWFTRAISTDPVDLLLAPNQNHTAVNEILNQTDGLSGEGQLQAFSDGSCTQEEKTLPSFLAHSCLLEAVQCSLRICRVGAGIGSGTATATLYIDCTAVVRTWHLPLEKQLALSQVYAGLMLSSYVGKNHTNIKEVRWIKSHQNALSAASEEEAREIRWNDEVEMLAKKGPPISRR